MKKFFTKLFLSFIGLILVVSSCLSTEILSTFNANLN